MFQRSTQSELCKLQKTLFSFLFSVTFGTMTRERLNTFMTFIMLFGNTETLLLYIIESSSLHISTPKAVCKPIPTVMISGFFSMSVCAAHTDTARFSKGESSKDNEKGSCAQYDPVIPFPSSFFQWFLAIFFLRRVGVASVFTRLPYTYKDKCFYVMIMLMKIFRKSKMFAEDVFCSSAKKKGAGKKSIKDYTKQLNSNKLCE